jgi:hypothetical protein
MVQDTTWQFLVLDFLPRKLVAVERLGFASSLASFEQLINCPAVIFVVSGINADRLAVVGSAA